MFFNGSDNNIVQTIKGGMERQEWTGRRTIDTKIASDGFYAYGKYGVLDGRKTAREGFYVYKFSFDGKMLGNWKKTSSIPRQEKNEQQCQPYWWFWNRPHQRRKTSLMEQGRTFRQLLFYKIEGADGKIVSEKK